MEIGKKKIGNGYPVFIIAEISCNHVQNKDTAFKLIEEAKKAGADAVKFQTYKPESLTIDCDNQYFKLDDTIWKGQTLFQLYKQTFTPYEWFPELKAKADKEGIIFFSSPFDDKAVDLLEKLKVPAYKIASFEINHIPLLEYIAKKKKPVILSTGVATEADIELALKTIRKYNKEIILLKCTSAYPSPLNEMNLRVISDMQERFKVEVGLSDHSKGITAALVSLSLGASVIEKHLKLTINSHSKDDAFSLTPEEFKSMVDKIREVEIVLGKVDYKLGKETQKHLSLKRSIFVTQDIFAGKKFTKDNIKIIRPGYGLHPSMYENILGKRAIIGIKRGTPLSTYHIKRFK
jgi:pseudaminic acid synthase